MSQGEMVQRLGVQDLIHYTNISKYELDKNEPPLAILLAYARLAGIPVEQIIDVRIRTHNLISARALRSFPTAINVSNSSRHGRVPC